MLAKNPFRRRLTIAGMLLIPVLLVGFKPVGSSLLRWQVLRSPAPSYDGLCTLAEETDDLPRLVNDLWGTGKLPQRFFATELLLTRRFTYEEARPLLEEALWDVDDDLRENALIYLAASRDPANLPLLSALIRDLDPRLQSRALALLAVQGNLTCGDWVAPLFDSPRLEVRTAAYAAFQRWTGHDDGVHLYSPDADLVRAGVYWADWWRANRPAEGLPPALAPPPLRRVPAPAIVAHDIDGRRLQLRDWGQTPHLILFWSQHDPRTSGALADCRQVAEAFGGAIRLVALNVDRIPAVHGHNYHGVREDDTPVDHDISQLQQAYLQPETWPWQQGLVSLDTVVAYRAQDTPVAVIVDGQGLLRRRLGYSRPAAGLAAMLAEVTGDPPVAAAPKVAAAAR